MAMLTTRLFTFMLLTLTLMHRLVIKTRAENQPLLDAIQAASKFIEYGRSNYQSLTFTEHLGVRVLEGQLKLLLAEHERGHHRTIPANIMAQLKAMVEEAGKMANAVVPHLLDRDANYFQLTHYQIRNPWLMFHPHRLVDSDALQYPYVPGPSSEISEMVRNKCIHELTGNDSNASKCQVTEKCLRVMVSPDHHGYSLQNQIYYTAFAERVGCANIINEYIKAKTSMQTISELQKFYCSTMYYELLHVVSLYGIQTSYKELFLLTQFSCPNLGFFEFLNKEWLALIISWQTPGGCFVLQNKKDSSARKKQDEMAIVEKRPVVAENSFNQLAANHHGIVHNDQRLPSAGQYNSDHRQNPNVHLLKEVPHGNYVHRDQRLRDENHVQQNPQVFVRYHGQVPNYVQFDQHGRQYMAENSQNRVANQRRQIIPRNHIMNSYRSDDQGGHVRGDNLQSNNEGAVPVHVADWVENQNVVLNQNDVHHAAQYNVPVQNDFQGSHPLLRNNNFKPVRRMPLYTELNSDDDDEISYNENLTEVVADALTNTDQQPSVANVLPIEDNDVKIDEMRNVKLKHQSHNEDTVQTQSSLDGSKSARVKLKRAAYENEWFPDQPSKFRDRRNHGVYDAGLELDHDPKRRKLLHNMLEETVRNEDGYVVDRDRHIGNSSERPVYLYYYPIYEQMRRMNKAKKQTRIKSESTNTKVSTVRKLLKQKFEGECHAQITGLAASALAMYIRFLIDPGPREFHRLRMNKPAGEADVEIVDHVREDGDAEDDAQPVYKGAKVYFAEVDPVVPTVVDAPLSKIKPYVSSRFVDPLYVGEVRKKLHPEENDDYVRKADKQRELVDRAFVKNEAWEEKRTLVKPDEVEPFKSAVESSTERATTKVTAHSTKLHNEGVHAQLRSLFSGQQITDLHRRIQVDLGYHLIIIIVVSFFCMILLYKYLRYKRFLLRHRTKAI